MKILEEFAILITSLQVIPRMLTETHQLLLTIRTMAKSLRSATSYENLMMDIRVDIGDAQGHRVTVDKLQEVRFLAEESGTVRDLIWGEGNAVSSYTVKGADRLSDRSEGSRRVALLGLPYQPAKGESASIESHRVIKDGFTNQDEYFEAVVERPTKELAVTVEFPASRPPKHARLVTIPAQPSKELPVDFRRNGRAFLSWSISNPTRHKLYRITWAW